MKSEFEVLINEIKSLSEIISILKEEINYHNTMSQERMMSKSSSTNSLYCSKCFELETQLKDTLSELNLMKLINVVLNEELETGKQPNQGEQIIHSE
jgi:hypothetical protein